MASNRDSRAYPTYNFPSTGFNFHFPPPSSEIGPSKTPSAARRPPDVPIIDRSPSPMWGSDISLPDVNASTDPKGKKRRIEEVANEHAKTKPRKKAAVVKPVPKKPTKPKKPIAVKKEVNSGAKRGRKAGSSGYSLEEIQKLLSLVEKQLPIGGAGWDLVMNEYNRWAKKNGYGCDRARKALRTKFDTVYIISLTEVFLNADT